MRRDADSPAFISIPLKKNISGFNFLTILCFRLFFEFIQFVRIRNGNVNKALWD